MNRKKLLYLAAFFTLFTFAGHTFGTLFPHPPKTVAHGLAITVMENTLVPMPMSPPRSLEQMFYGGNAVISLYLLITGLFFILSSKPENYVRNLMLLNSGGLAVCAAISVMFFFPLPAVCTGIAAVLGFVATRPSAIGIRG